MSFELQTRAEAVRSTRILLVLVVLAFSPGAAHAEGIVEPPKKTQSKDRIFGATTLVATPNALVPMGGASLRVFDRRSGKTKTLRARERDDLTAVASDAAGRRMVAAWKWDRELHLFDLASGAHRSVPRPNFEGANATGLELSADGKSVFVFNTGGGAGVEVYRVSLVEPGRQELLFGGGLGQLIWESPAEAITQCPIGRCPDVRIVHRALDTGVETVLAKVGGDSERLATVRAVRGSAPGDVVLFVNHAYGPRHRLIRYRARDGLVVDVELPKEISNFVGNNIPPIGYSPSLERVYLLTRPGYELAIWSQSLASAPPPPAQEVARVPPLAVPAPRSSTAVYGFAVRPPDQGVVVHWGDDVVLVGPDGKIRSADLTALTGGRPEWAGVALLVGAPEELWVGVERERSRDFARVTLSDVEAKAKPARAVVIPPQPPDDKQRGSKQEERNSKAD